MLVGISLLWWLPDRPLALGEVRNREGWRKWILESRPALTGEDAQIHYEDLARFSIAVPGPSRTCSVSSPTGASGR